MPADRIEAVLSAIFYTLRLIAATQGIKPDLIDRYAGSVDAVRPREWIEPTQEELDAREDEEIRRLFAPSIKRALALSETKQAQ